MADDYREEEIIVPLRCPNCGGLNPPENKVCQLCGFRLTGATPVSPPGVDVVRSGDPSASPPAPSPVTNIAPAAPSIAPASAPPTPNSPAGRGSSLAARLGGAGSAAPPPAEWLGDLRRNIGGDAPAVNDQPLPPPPPPTIAAYPSPAARSAGGGFSVSQPDDQVGYVAPPTPSTSPYRREDLPRPNSEPVDWLASLRASSSLSPEAEQDAPDEEEESPPVAVPDWLHRMRAESAASAAVTAGEDDVNDAPPWLTDEVAEDTGPLDRADSVGKPVPDLHPWLHEGTVTRGSDGATQTDVPPSAAQAINLPPWLQQPPEPAPPAPPDFSDLFTNRPAANVAAAGQAPPSTTTLGSSGGFLEDSDAPAWLREVAAAQPPPMPQAMTAMASPAAAEAAAATEAGSPEITESDALDQDDVSAAPPAWLSPPASDGEDAVETALPDESEAVSPADEAPDQEQAEVSEATPTTPAASEVVSTTPPIATASGEDLPPWLRVVGGESAASMGDSAMPTPVVAAAATPTTASFFPTGNAEDNTVPDWLRGIGRESQDGSPASAEALTAAVAEPVQHIQRVMTVRSPRPGAAEALAALVAAPSASTRTSPLELKDERKVSASVMRWLLSERGIYLLTALVMVVVVLADRVGGLQPLAVTSPAANAQVDSFYKTINNLETQSGAPVLVAYDWDANRQAEMAPLARAITCHLGAINARFATVSLSPTGPAFAQQVALATVDSKTPCTTRRYQYGSDYVNLGYSAGGDFALRSMVGSIATVFSNDYVNGNPLFGAGGVPALKGIKSLGDFKLIIVLEGDESTARSWVEQVASQPNTPPLLLGEPAALDPSLQPYLAVAAPTRFVGKVAGLSDVARYQYDLTAKGLNMAKTDLSFNLNALSFAALLIALLIIIGNIVFIARLVNRRK